MAFRSDSPFWEISLGVLQDFDHGQIVEDTVPASWNLKPGDSLEYEAGCNISGIAEVVSIGNELVDCWVDGGCGDGEDIKVPGLKCKFRKVS